MSICHNEQSKDNENITDEENVTIRKKTAKPTLQIYRPPCSRTSTIEEKVEKQNKKNITTDGVTESKDSLSQSSVSSKGSSLNQNSKLKENNNKNNSHTKMSTALISTTMKEFPKKKIFGNKEIEDITNGLKRINALKDTTLIDKFLASNMTDFEENRVEAKNTAKITANLIDCPSGESFHMSLLNSLKQYFECRDQLRENHFKIWTTFINFMSETFANIGFTYEGDLVELIFTTFEYLLLPPTLHNLRIEELECLISGLLAIGYDLERVCPERLGSLKELIRDGLIEVQEPWARKMIMLLMELGASGWKLPTEANEYYFH